MANKSEFQKNPSQNNPGATSGFRVGEGGGDNAAVREQLPEQAHQDLSPNLDKTTGETFDIEDTHVSGPLEGLIPLNVFSPQEVQALSGLHLLEANRVPKSITDPADQAAISMQTPDRVSRTGERPVGPLQFDFKHINQGERTVQLAQKTGSFSPQTQQDLELFQLEHDSGSQADLEARNDYYFALFTSRPRDAMALNLAGLQDMKNDEAKLKNIESPVATTFVYNNPSEAMRVMASMFGMPFDGGTVEKAVASRTAVSKRWKAFEEEVGLDKADDAFMKHVPKFLKERGTDNESTKVLQSRYIQLKEKGGLAKMRGATAVSDLPAHFGESVTNFSGGAPRDLAQEHLQRNDSLENRKSLTKIGANLPLTDTAGIVETILDAAIFVNDWPRTKVVEFLKDHEVAFVEDDLPDSISGPKLLSLIFGLPDDYWDMEFANPKLDTSKPYMQQLIQTVNETHGINPAVQNFQFVIGLGAEIGTGGLTYIGAMFNAVSMGAAWSLKNAKKLKALFDKVDIDKETMARLKQLGEDYNKAWDAATERLSQAGLEKQTAEKLAAGELPAEGLTKLRPDQIPDAAGTLSTQAITLDAGTSLVTKVQALAAKGGIKADPALWQEILRDTTHLTQLTPTLRGIGNKTGRNLKVLDPEQMTEHVRRQRAQLKEINDAMAKLETNPDAFFNTLATMKTPEQMAAFTKSLEGTGWSRLIADLQVGTLLMSLQNLVVANPVTNTLSAGYHLVRKYAGALPRFGLGERENTFTEAWAYNYQLIAGLGDSAKMAWQAAKDGTIVGTHGTKIDLFKADSKSLTNLAERAKGTWFEYPARAVDEVFKIAPRLLAGTDTFYRTMNGRAESAAKLWREFEQGLHGSKSYRDARLEMFNDPSKYREYIAPIRDGLHHGEVTTFTQASGPIGQATLKVLQAYPLMRTLIGFVRTPLNLAEAVFTNGSPSRQVIDLLKGNLTSSDPATRAKALTEVYMTAATMGGLWKMTQLDGRIRVRGPGPLDKGTKLSMEENTKEQYNVLQYSTKNDGVYDVSIPYSNWGPLGVQLSIMSFIEQNSGMLDDDQIYELTMGAFATTISGVADMSIYSNLGEVLTMMERADDGQPHVVQEALNRLALSVDPLANMGKKVESFTDPVKRQAQTLLDHHINITPGFSTKNPARYTLFAHPLTGTGGFGDNRIYEHPEEVADLGFQKAFIESVFRGKVSSEQDQREFKAMSFARNILQYTIPRIVKKQTIGTESGMKEVELTNQGISQLQLRAGRDLLGIIEQMQKIYSSSREAQIQQLKNMTHVDIAIEETYANLLGQVISLNRAQHLLALQNEDKGEGLFFVQAKDKFRITRPQKGIAGPDPTVGIE